jgi:hypothetical protein
MAIDVAGIVNSYIGNIALANKIINAINIDISSGLYNDIEFSTDPRYYIYKVYNNVMPRKVIVSTAEAIANPIYQNNPTVSIVNDPTSVTIESGGKVYRYDGKRLVRVVDEPYTGFNNAMDIILASINNYNCIVPNPISVTITVPVGNNCVATEDIVMLADTNIVFSPISDIIVVTSN